VRSCFREQLLGVIFEVPKRFCKVGESARRKKALRCLPRRRRADDPEGSQPSVILSRLSRTSLKREQTARAVELRSLISTEWKTGAPPLARAPGAEAIRTDGVEPLGSRALRDSWSDPSVACASARSEEGPPKTRKGDRQEKCFRP